MARLAPICTLFSCGLHTWIRHTSISGNLIQKHTKRPDIRLCRKLPLKCCLWCRPFDRKLCCYKPKMSYLNKELIVRTTHKLINCYSIYSASLQISCLMTTCLKCKCFTSSHGSIHCQIYYKLQNLFLQMNILKYRIKPKFCLAEFLANCLFV